MRVFESPHTRSDINSASIAVRMSRQGTGWDAVEDKISARADISERGKSVFDKRNARRLFRSLWQQWGSPLLQRINLQHKPARDVIRL